MIEVEEQPAIFSSIPAAMWWAIETLTTVGYGDMVPATVAGKFLGGLVSIVGIGTLALFSGVITVGFLDQLRIRREQDLTVRISLSEKSLNELDNQAGSDDDYNPLVEWNVTSSFADGTQASQTCSHCGQIIVGHQYG
jgi:voltage-gated potassium channel